MPTYEYRCLSCEHQFERFQRMSDEPVKECEVCGEPVKRLLFPCHPVQGQRLLHHRLRQAQHAGRRRAAHGAAAANRSSSDRSSDSEGASSSDSAKPAASEPRKPVDLQRPAPRTTEPLPAAMAGRDCALVAFGSIASAHRSHQRRRSQFARPGALKTALDPLGEVRIVAPDQNRSGAARSITMHAPLWVEEVELADGSLAYSTDGTPVDCVRMAALGLLDRTPDLIVSGINLGGNLGDDITYSGTVAAAFEGIMLDIPAIALSAEGYHPGYDLTVPARFAHRLVVDRAGDRVSRPRPCSTSTAPTGPGRHCRACG